jgi:tRNA pseudouridine55 synthase
MAYNNGIILTNKPSGITSFKACETVKKKLGVKKAGHGGTLDPFATGLLIIGVNKGTKLLDIISAYPKEYTGKMVLGEKKDTFDVTGKTVSKADPVKLSNITEKNILEIKENFIGTIKQTPPLFSALKKNGKPLYKYAREGKQVEIPERAVFIEKFEITEIKLPEIKFIIKCSKGTYIRSIANDIGEMLGVYGYLKELCRTSVNGYFLENACNISDVSREKIIPFEKALKIKNAHVKEEYFSLLENGNIIPVDSLIENFKLLNNEYLYVTGKSCIVVGMYSDEKKVVKPKIVYKKSLH